MLDLGGGHSRRGEVVLGSAAGRVVHVDIAEAPRPDVLADASSLPFVGGVFDVVVCSELMEHVSEPEAILAEVRRVLRSGGMLFLCAPFLYRIHADPDDFARYTASFWAHRLSAHGFVVRDIEKQGLYWSVLVDLVRAYLAHRLGGRGLGVRIAYRLASVIVQAGKRFAIRRDSRQGAVDDPLLGSFTTGFAVIATKQ